MICTGDIEKYYENTEYAIPHSIVRKFMGMKVKPANAIDLGCGVGRDTIFLIKNNWNLLSIDKEDTEETIANKLDEEEVKRFRFDIKKFEEIELEENNLVVANFSIPFCNKSHFNELWCKITDSILKERVFCWEFFWIK